MKTGNWCISQQDPDALFYRTCSGEVCNDIHLSEAEVQELRKQFNHVYAQATREGPKAKRMGQTLLANQFVAGLRLNLLRACLYPKKTKQSEEARGWKEGALSALANSRTNVEQRVDKLKEQLHFAEMLMAVNESSDIL